MANVYSKRRTLATELSRELGGNFVVAKTPDHPFVLRGPDILFGGKGQITGVFFPSAVEVRDPNKLRARFILNRLALPSQTKTVLVFEPSQEKLAQFFAMEFDAILP